MADNLEKIFGEPETDTQTPPSEPEKVQVEKKPEDEEVLKKKAEVEKLTLQEENLKKAIQEAETILRKKRSKTQPPEEEELPKIDMEDPSSKAWDKHIKETVAPVQSDLEQAKAERRMFALRQFLTDRPSLASNTEKIKDLMGTYEKIKTSSELTSEGILLDIERAYYADNYQDVFATSDAKEIEKARAESIASEIGVSRGATGYTPRREASIPLSEDDKAVLAKWNITPEQWQDEKKKQEEKKKTG